MAQTLQTLSVISYAVAALSFALAVFFWFFFKIPTVIGDLSGRTAKKSIAKMRAANEKKGVQPQKKSVPLAKQSTQTAKPSEDPSRKQKTEKVIPCAPSVAGEQETSLLGENAAVAVESEATGLLVDENETAPLDAPVYRQTERIVGKKLEMIQEVMLIHTDEVIG